MRKIVVVVDHKHRVMHITSSGKPKVYVITQTKTAIRVKFGWSGFAIVASLSRLGQVDVQILHPGINVEVGELIYYGGVFIQVSRDLQASMPNLVCTALIE